MTATTSTDRQSNATEIAESLGCKVEVRRQAGDCWDVRIYGTGVYNRRRDVSKANIGLYVLQMLAESVKGFAYKQATSLTFQQAVELLSAVPASAESSKSRTRKPAAGKASDTLRVYQDSSDKIGAVLCRQHRSRFFVNNLAAFGCGEYGGQCAHCS